MPSQQQHQLTSIPELIDMISGKIVRVIAVIDSSVEGEDQSK